MNNIECQKIVDELVEALDTENKVDKWVTYLHQRIVKCYGPEAVERIRQKAPLPKKAKHEVIIDEETWEN